MLFKFLKKFSIKSSFKAKPAKLREEGRTPLNEITKLVKQIEMNTLRKMESRMLGDYRSRFKGQGMQFSDFRVYQYGDDTRHIDWRASAKSQQTLLKTFEEERELNIICAIDVSKSNDFGSAKYTKKEATTLAMASIAFSAVKNSDRVGLLLFSDQIEKFIPPKKGKKHILRLIDILLSYEPKSDGTNITAASKFLCNQKKQHSVIFIASDFFGTMNRKILRQLSAKNDVIALFVKDKRDQEIPNIGLLQIRDPETGETKIIDTSSKKNLSLINDEQAERNQRVKNLLSESGINIIEIDTQESPIDKIKEYFHARGKKIK